MKIIGISSFLVLFLWAGLVFSVELTGTLNRVLVEERIVVIDQRQYYLAEDAVVRWQSDPDLLVFLSPGLNGRTVLYEFGYSEQRPTVKKLVISDNTQ